MTKRIPDFERYASEISRIRQKEGKNWCIPANIEAVTKYFDPKSSVTQEYLVNKLEEACKQSEEVVRSFFNYKNKVLDSDPNYTWAASCIKSGKIDTLAFSLIPSEIDKGPVILSLCSHVYTVVECNDLGGLRLHDTRDGKLLCKSLDEMRRDLPEGNKSETDMLIIRPR
jgi:hypothetical protein